MRPSASPALQSARPTRGTGTEGRRALRRGVGRLTSASVRPRRRPRSGCRPAPGSGPKAISWDASVTETIVFAVGTYRGRMDHLVACAACSPRGSLRAVLAQTLLLAAILAAPRTSSARTPPELVASLQGTTLEVTATEGSPEPRSIRSYAQRLNARLIRAGRMAITLSARCGRETGSLPASCWVTLTPMERPTSF